MLPQSRNLVRTALVVLAVLVSAPPTRASESENSSVELPPSFDEPATPDETLQLHVTAAGYGALTGVWLAELADSGPMAQWVAGFGAAGLGLGTIAWIDSSRSLTFGLPQALVTDAMIGLEIGAAWAWRFHAQADAAHEPTVARQLTLLWGGATAGAALGALRYALSPSDPGRAAFTGTATLWAGAVSGLLAGALTERRSARDDNASLALAFGLEGGVILASFTGRWLQPSLGWVRALDLGAVLGGSIAAGGYALISSSALDDRTTLAAGAVGIGAGLVGAALLAPRLGLPRDTGLVFTPDLALGSGRLGVSASGAF